MPWSLIRILPCAAKMLSFEYCNSNTMRARKSNYLWTVIAALVLLAHWGLPSSSGEHLSQSTPHKPKPERFGSSLDRLKWDSAANHAIEKDRKTEAAGTDVLRLSTLLVVLNTLVTDSRSRPVAGLTRDDFTVLEDGQPQEISVFSGGNEGTVARKLLLIIDRSGSERAYLESSLEAAKRLVADLLPSDQMAIVTDDVEMIVSYTADKMKLKIALDGLGSGGRAPTRSGESGPKSAAFHSRSMQFTALFAALRELVKDDGSRHVTIFQTDGDEAPTFRDQPDAGDYIWNMPRRNYGLADIYSAAQRSNAMIYTIIPSEKLLGLGPGELLERGRLLLERMERARFNSEREYVSYSIAHPISDAKVKLFAGRFAAGQLAAERVAEMTGGWASYLEHPEQAASIYSAILSDMNHRYVIGYYPSDNHTASAQGGRLRHLKIAVKSHPEYIVRGRDSYLPPDR